MRGDLNHDGRLTVADVGLLLSQVLGVSPATPETADLNADGRITISDLQLLINKLL